MEGVITRSFDVDNVEGKKTVGTTRYVVGQVVTLDEATFLDWSSRGLVRKSRVVKKPFDDVPTD